MIKKLLFLACACASFNVNLVGALPDWYGFISYLNLVNPPVGVFNLTQNNTPETALPIVLNPNAFGISNDANWLYVVSRDSTEIRLTPVDISTTPFVVGTSIQLGAIGGTTYSPMAMSVDPTKAYVLYNSTPGNNGFLTEVDLTIPGTPIAGTTLSLGNGSSCTTMVITPDGTRAYICARSLSQTHKHNIT